MATSFESPADFAAVNDKGVLTTTWRQWITWIHVTVSSLRQSGATAERPVKNLWIGRMFYDTTLGKPVWVHSVGPVVWHDASGAVV